MICLVTYTRYVAVHRRKGLFVGHDGKYGVWSDTSSIEMVYAFHSWEEAHFVLSAMREEMSLLRFHRVQTLDENFASVEELVFAGVLFSHD